MHGYHGVFCKIPNRRDLKRLKYLLPHSRWRVVATAAADVLVDISNLGLVKGRQVNDRKRGEPIRFLDRNRA